MSKIALTIENISKSHRLYQNAQRFYRFKQILILQLLKFDLVFDIVRIVE